MARLTLYDPKYCDLVVEMGRNGASVIEMATVIGVHRQTLEMHWPAANPDFADALTHARELSQVWWEVKGRDNLTSPVFQTGVWSRSMAARFPADWREVKGTELTGKDGKPIETQSTVIDRAKLTDEQLRVIASINV